ncbi:hypothetical protein SDC9_192914 [bioreactor metagenome]|uniref:Uncharacterized protein n=1 Tax=bioreactor metagenome TaxID=1076179 RepID=A0A645I221_9ZZZZ
MTLDSALEALTLSRPGHIDQLTSSKEGDRDLVPRLQIGEVRRSHIELLEDVTGLNPRLGQMAGKRLDDAGSAALAESHLDRGIAVGFRGLDLGDAIVRHIKHRHRDGCTIVSKDASHADLAPDKA